MDTATLLADYRRSLAKAEREGICVSGEGFGPKQQPCWIVPSSKHTRNYRVTLTDNGFSCTCPAGLKQQYCKHRAATRCHIIKMAESQALEALALAEGWTTQQWAAEHAKHTPQPQTVPAGYIPYDGGATIYRPTWIGGRPYVPTR